MEPSGVCLLHVPAPIVSTFFRSAASSSDLPEDERAEVALLGRSNVGKSSLLNSLLGNQKLAFTSKTPGRTRLMNYFLVEPERSSRSPFPPFFLVDLPGYGYARVSRATAQEWSREIEPYLRNRQQLALAVQLIDPAIPTQESDLDLHRWLVRRKRNVVLVATKCDRLSGNERSRALGRLKNDFGQALLPYSSKTGEGRDALWRTIVDAVQTQPEEQ